MSNLLANILEEDVRMTQYKKALKALEDVIRDDEYRTIEDSAVAQAGVVVADFTLGAVALRWIFTNYTYFFIDLMKEMGRLSYVLKDRQTKYDPYKTSVSMIATFCLWVVKDYAAEREGRITPAMGLREANRVMRSLKVPDDIQIHVRSAFRHHFRLYISESGCYHCGLTQMVAEGTVSPKTGWGSGTVVRLPSGNK